MEYADELRKEGVVLIRSKFKNNSNIIKKEVERIIKENDLYNIKSDPSVDFNKLRKLNKPFFNKRICSRDGDEGLIDIWNFDQLVEKKCKDSIKEIDSMVLGLIQESFGVKYCKKTVNLYINNSVEKTRGIHADSHFFPSRIKCFLYLTKVDSDDCGPFCFIKKSHLKEGLKYHRKYDIYNPITQEDKKNFVVFNDLDIGDIAIAAVSGAHRGLPQKKGFERIALVISYDPV